MRTWTRARLDVRCTGPCGRLIPAGELIFELHLPELHRVPRRCAKCAGEPVPDDLPLLAPATGLTRATPVIPLTRFTAGMLPLDFKARQAGEREPGQEG